MIRILPALAATSLLLSNALAQAAILRNETSLASPSVRVADLFDLTGAAGERVLGPAPAPGSRIVVEAPQLAAIARQFGVDWRPMSPADRVVLDRPGRLLPREQVLEALRTALADLGAAPGVDVVLAGFTAPMVARDARSEVAVEQIDFEASTGRFTASLVVTSSESALQRLRVSGSVDEVIEVAVPTRRLTPGMVIEPGDIRIARLRTGFVHGDVAHLSSQVIGRALRRSAFPGQPIALADLGRPSAIQKGARVTMALQAAGLSLAAEGVALEEGVIGEQIAILNPSTRAVVRGEVTGPGSVVIAAGTLPLPAARNPAAMQALAQVAAR